MNIIVVGLSHRTASVEIREKLSIPETKVESAIAHLLKLPHIKEVAIISTCNRLEIYAVTQEIQEGVEEISHFLSEVGQIPRYQLQQHLFILLNEEAIRHLIRVAAGLESLVLGEGQISCQVKQAHKLAQTYKGLGKLLDRLFKYALTASKRIRTEIHIGTGAVSISSAAVELAQTKVQDLADYRITIIGAGKMARLLIRHLLAKGAVKISVVNRSQTGAEKLASEFPDTSLQLYSLSEMMSAIAQSDIVFTCTAATEPILDRVKLETILPKHQSLMLFDISVPRNVSADVSELEKTEVYNVDDLKAVVAQNQETRRQMAQKAEVFLTEEVEAFMLWWQSLASVPIMNCLRNKVENIRTQEVEKTLSHLGTEFAEKHQEALEVLTRGIINKILHEPTVQLRTQRDIEAQRLALEVLQSLFNLDLTEQYNSVSKTV
ncbi:glutamyl-tRNA reductase [Nostocales cyanobacterium HT-58-2]|nr:glutamyl-tRNA reductase [Nostocales cyanobacterium HT-58-2]